MFNLASIVLSLVLATLYAALFHFLLGRSGRQLAVTWLAGLVGFALGQLLATLFSWHDLLIGEVHVLAATAASWLVMFFAKRLRV